MASRSRFFLALIAAGAIVRIVAAVLTTNSPDLALFGYVVQQGGLGHSLYADPGFSYPPLVGYLFVAFGKLLNALGQPVIVHVAALQAYRLPGLAIADLTTPAASFLIKSPAMLGDVAAAWIIDMACRRLGVSDVRRQLAVLAWWLNPMVVFDSAVQASWDSIVPTAIIASGLAAIDRKDVTSGAWLAVGALSKLVPVLCIPLVLATVFGRERGLARRFGAILAFAGGGIAMAILILIPVIYWGQLSTLLRDTVFTRTGGAMFGGFNIWAVLTVTSLSGVAAWITAHAGTVAQSLLLTEVCVIIAVAVDIVRRPDVTLERWVSAATLTIAAVLLTAAYAQPGYAVWIIPFCLLLWARGSSVWGAFALLLSVFSFVFTMAVRAPAALIVPACWFYRLCDAVAMQRATFDYGYAGGAFTPLLQLDRDTVLGVAGAVVIFAIAVKSAVELMGGRRA